MVGKMMTQLRLATSNGLKGKDDIIDTISMLAFLKPYAPSSVYSRNDTDISGGIFHPDDEEAEVSPLTRYV